MGTEIPVWVGGVQKWVTGVGRRTTCEDVVRALLDSWRPAKCSSTNSDCNYALVELCQRGIERHLDGRSRILKLWAGDDVKLSLRRVKPLQSPWSSPSPPTSDPCAAHSRHRRRHRRPCGSSSTSSSPSPCLFRTVHPRKLSAAQEEDRQVADLVKSVICQGETLERQAALLARRDAEIERHETKMHALRVRQLGPDYLLDGYRPESEDESLQTRQTAVALYEQLLDVCRRIASEEEKVQRLSSELRECSWEQETLQRTEDRLTAVRQELDHLSELDRSQQETMEMNHGCLLNCDRVLAEKRRCLGQLEEQLRVADAEAIHLQIQLQLEDSVGSGGRCCCDVTDSSSDTGVSSMHSCEEGVRALDTLV
ncbi:peptidylglycine alpha-amidating monooxygenase cooh-terminal interactor protein-1, putative [Ixodes scapularis]|uniref:Peptidylglycine alpha-amidating monooxygenase cooh-terminal interactor protein-1, putative n=1 Tax=Ixodes scapularis TaxID=6945 RepID=B7PV72_IXOSC|nr:peptidylglycine alpha-amidating monooxygenase cooh-terminal interactor protein-1, putative [Ixodes scapularis]|eukprot:XP_002407525.1 peptidylglycine alpha-amidating monooxygenase cooh-terminal interactor protein-1, putative [Ixodes scapularis]